MTTDDRLERIERLVEANSQAIGELTHRMDQTDQRWQSNDLRWQQQEVDNRVILERIDTYQKSSNQVVNLAFALIGAATVALVGIVLRLAVNL